MRAYRYARYGTCRLLPWFFERTTTLKLIQNVNDRLGIHINIHTVLILTERAEHTPVERPEIRCIIKKAARFARWGAVRTAAVFFVFCFIDSTLGCLTRLCLAARALVWQEHVVGVSPLLGNLPRLCFHNKIFQSIYMCFLIFTV